MQSIQLAAPVEGMAWPIGQSSHLVKFVPLMVFNRCWPARQFLHCCSPFWSWNCPGIQSTHLAAPFKGITLPAGQFTHAVKFVPLMAFNRCCPARQSLHCCSPFWSWNCPGMQSTHLAAPFEGMTLPAGQFTHVVKSVSSMVFKRCWPGRHSWHSCWPFSFWNCPGMHPTQYASPIWSW